MGFELENWTQSIDVIPRPEASLLQSHGVCNLVQSRLNPPTTVKNIGGLWCGKLDGAGGRSHTRQDCLSQARDIKLQLGGAPCSEIKHNLWHALKALYSIEP